MHHLLLAESSHKMLRLSKFRPMTYAVGRRAQGTFELYLLSSPYLCNFLLWHGSSLCRGPSQVTIMCHMSNVMEIEALYLVHEKEIMTSSCKISSRRLTGTIIFVFVICPTIFCHVPIVCTRIAISKEYTLVPG